jgi:hypothetical protein
MGLEIEYISTTVEDLAAEGAPPGSEALQDLADRVIGGEAPGQVRRDGLRVSVWGSGVGEDVCRGRRRRWMRRHIVIVKKWAQNRGRGGVARLYSLLYPLISTLYFPISGIPLFPIS